MKKEARRWCDRCNRTGKVRVDLAARDTSGGTWGSCSHESEMKCPDCGGRGERIEITETIVTYRKLENNEK